MFSLSDWKLIYKLEAIVYVKEAEKDLVSGYLQNYAGL